MSIRERHQDTVRTQWRLLALFAAALLSLFGVAALFASGPLQRGVIVGAGVTLAACAVAANTAQAVLPRAALGRARTMARPLGSPRIFSIGCAGSLRTDVDTDVPPGPRVSSLGELVNVSC